MLEQVKSRLLLPYGLDESALEHALSSLSARQIDLGDLYFQLTHSESWVLEDGIVKDGRFNIDQGVGVRAVAGEKTGFSYSDDITPEALLAATRSARAISRTQGQGTTQAWQRRASSNLYAPVNPLTSLTETEKLALLHRADEAARRCDARVTQVVASLVGSEETMLVAATDGTLAGDIRPMVRFNVSVVIEHQGRREQGSAGGGGRYDYTSLLEAGVVEAFAEEAVRQAQVALEAVAAPAGNMTVVLGNGWPGVLLHEAVGHGLEGDFNRKGTSAFSGRLGERVAAAGCTVVDDGTLPGRRGSLHVDDEGTPTCCTPLIEDGVLTGYMQDKMNARLMGQSLTGNARRQSYSSLPLPRMTNTYMLPGQCEPDEILASVENGLYAVNFGGGQVDITSGKFVFSASEAYLIENGVVTQPVKGATLIGHGPDVLHRVSMVGNDLRLDKGVGVCGKAGQSVPVGVGQPTLRVDGLTVGGTSA